MNWEALKNKLIIPPFKPNVESLDDTTNID